MAAYAHAIILLPHWHYGTLFLRAGSYRFRDLLVLYHTAARTFGMNWTDGMVGDVCVTVVWQAFVCGLVPAWFGLARWFAGSGI